MHIKMSRPVRLAAFALTVLMLLLGIGADSVLAGNVHFNQQPTFTKAPTPLQLTAAGTIYGLGNGDVLVTLNATGTANLQCTNPGGSTKVPGQNPNFSASGSASIPASQVKNGHASFTVTTNPPTSPVPNAPDCPNSGWTETITSITWTSARIRVYQPCVGPDPTGCPLVLDQTFNQSPFPF